MVSYYNVSGLEKEIMVAFNFCSKVF